MSKIKVKKGYTRKNKIKKKIPKIKARKRSSALRIKKTRKDAAVAENIFDSEVGKTDALFVDNPKTDTQLNPQSNSDINEALKEFDVLPENQIKNNPAHISGKEAIDLSNLTGADDLNTPPRHSKEENKRFSWKKLFPFFKK
jgi:hypothetical protein